MILQVIQSSGTPRCWRALSVGDVDGVIGVVGGDVVVVLGGGEMPTPAELMSTARLVGLGQIETDSGVKFRHHGTCAGIFYF